MAALHRRCIGILVISVLLSQLIPPRGIQAAVEKHLPAAAEDFPVYPQIKPNMEFWISIFTRYSKDQGVIHDLMDLSKVYGVIPLDPARTRAAAAKNRRTQEKALKEWKAALILLSQGRSPGGKKRDKLIALFGKNPDPKELKRAASSLRIQSGLKQHFKEGLIRSGALVPEFKKIFRSHGLPEDLVYLPCVESSFNVNAYSKFGAAGVWQFTRSTGKLYMEIGYVVDERRDPFTATWAAARLLKRNHEALEEWPLAITAYNHGLNGMKRAKKQHGTYPEIYRHYRSRAFKFASRNFYSEFLAARQVAKNHADYFGEIAFATPVPHTRFTTRGYLSAADMARELRLSPDIIRQMNPALRSPVFDGRKYIPKGFELRLPKAVSPETAAQALTGLYKDKQKPSRFHRVQRGDTAGSIARIHKVSLGDLILANSLNRRATIYIGQTLRIPSREEPLVSAAIAAAAPLQAVKRQKVTKPVSLKTEQEAPPVEPVPAAIEPEASQPAAVPAPSAPMEPSVLQVVTADLNIIKQIPGKAQNIGIIHVAPEETLGHYADWLKVPTQRIRILNGMAYGKSISIGQKIRIPLPAEEFEAFEEKRYEFHQEILEDFFASFFISGTDTYQIKSGDTLWNLCINELEIPLWLLEKYNPDMGRHALKPGQQVVYPLVSPNGFHATGAL